MDTAPSASSTSAQAAPPPATPAVQPAAAQTPAAASTEAPPATGAQAAAPAANAQAAAADGVAGIPARPAKTTALAQQPSAYAPPSAAGSVGGTLFALALVIGLIFGLAWLARRMPGLGGVRGNSGLRVLRTLPLGTRERLVVVEVAGTQLLLSSGAGGTRLLHTLETPLPADPPAQPVPFAQLLAQRLGKKPA